MEGSANFTAEWTDRELQAQVLNALDCDLLDRAAIGVTVSHGVVTLLGRVRSRREAWIAEGAVHATPGVMGIANALKVEDGARDDDSGIAEAAVNALTRYRAAELGTVKVIASNGYVTLTGIVADMHTRSAAERAVRHLRGVRGVWNALKIVQAPERTVCEVRDQTWAN